MNKYKFKITYRNEDKYGHYWGDNRHNISIIAETLEQAKEKLDKIEKNCDYPCKNILNWEAEEIIQENQQQEIIHLNKKIKKLEEANKILSKEITKGNVVGQGMITECCGIPLGDIPKLIEYEQRNKSAIDCLNGILTEAYLDESDDVDIGLVEYAVSLLLGEK